MADDKVEIEIVLDDGSIKKGFANVKKEGQKTESALKGLGKALAGIAVAATIKKVVDAAAAQEQAVRRLNVNLALAGRFSEEASQSFQKLASEIQATTTVGDEEALSIAALGANFARTNEEAEKLTKAAIDLSAATGLSLDGSIKNLGKTLSGLTGELGESVPQLRGLSAEALRAGAGIDLIAQRFGGAAQGELATFSGALKQAQNSFGDLSESIGEFIIKNPFVVEGVKAVGRVFASTANDLRSFRESLDFTGIAQRLNSAFLGISVVVTGIADVVTSLFIGLLSSLVGVVQKVVSTIAKPFVSLAELVAPESEIVKNIKQFNKTMAEDAAGAFNVAGEAFKGAFDFETTQNVIANFELMSEAIDKGADALRNVEAAAPAAAISFSQAFGEFQDGFFDAGLTATDETGRILEANEKIRKAMKQTAISARNTLGAGIGNAFAAVGRAFVDGENAIEAFAKAFIGAIGQMAIQSGTRFILEGLAYLTVPGFQAVGGAMIAAGAALATFGGVLSAISGGGGDAAAGGGGGAGGASGFASEKAGVDGITEEEEIERSASVTVNVEGQILDPVGTATKIAELLSEVTDSNDITVNA